jgi:hypothetical protein
MQGACSTFNVQLSPLTVLIDPQPLFEIWAFCPMQVLGIRMTRYTLTLTMHLHHCVVPADSTARR